MRVVYEDQLPSDMTDAEYADWFSRSWVDGVRVGPATERSLGEESPSTGRPYRRSTEVTEGCRPSLRCQVPVGGLAGHVGQPVRSLTSAQRHESTEAIDRCSYAVAVTDALPIPTRQRESRVAETSAVAVRCLSHAVTSVLPRETPLFWQVLTADAKLPWSRLMENRFLGLILITMRRWECIIDFRRFPIFSFVGNYESKRGRPVLTRSYQGSSQCDTRTAPPFNERAA